PAPAPARARPSAAERAQIDAQPVPHAGNLAGALLIMMKAEAELSAGTPAESALIRAKVESIETKGDARAYIASVMEKVGIAREQRRLAAQGR
ncbi:MAG: phospholipase, partial [Sphingomonadales bacterium]|nr:phospholipase [Sphingomonadales bacterium]